MEVGFLGALALAVVAGFLGGLVARRVGLPVILGYLFAGVAIGPFTPGPVAEGGAIGGLAELGVAFLMFALGTELARSELRDLGRTALIAGTLQVVALIALGPAIAPLLGLTFAQGIFLGALLSLSSTVVALKLLMARGEAQSLHGRAALAILIAQDLAVVPMVILLPTLGAGPGYLEVIQHVVSAVLVIAIAYGMGTRMVPWLLGHAAGVHTRELFLVGLVALALGTALATSALGLSPAFGAFVAGLVLAGSEYRTQVLAEVLPLRDLFISLFFVSIGTLVDPRSLFAHPVELLALLVAVILLKPLLSMGALRLAGVPLRTGLLAGAALAQMGEFSFVLARVGVEAGALPAELFELVIAAAVISIVAAPVLMGAAPRLVPLLERIPGAGAAFAAPVDPGEGATGLRRHVVICGFGRVGRELAAALERRGLRYLVIDYDQNKVRDLRGRGVRAIYGDAANPQVLEHAGLDGAVLVAVLVADPATAEAITRFARAHGPRLDIVARAADARDILRLREAGASEVVQPEFEAGIEVIRHSLGRLGVSARELDNVTAGRRRAFYSQDDTEARHGR